MPWLTTVHSHGGFAENIVFVCANARAAAGKNRAARG
jgi:hypothetical protein